MDRKTDTYIGAFADQNGQVLAFRRAVPLPGGPTKTAEQHNRRKYPDLMQRLDRLENFFNGQ